MVATADCGVMFCWSLVVGETGNSGLEVVGGSAGVWWLAQGVGRLVLVDGVIGFDTILT